MKTEGSLHHAVDVNCPHPTFAVWIRLHLLDARFRMLSPKEGAEAQEHPAVEAVAPVLCKEVEEPTLSRYFADLVQRSLLQPHSGAPVTAASQNIRQCYKVPLPKQVPSGTATERGRHRRPETRKTATKTAHLEVVCHSGTTQLIQAALESRSSSPRGGTDSRATLMHLGPRFCLPREA